MMVQNAPAGEPRFISTMVEHNDLCGQFVAAFGNVGFARPEPYDEMVYVIGHHDRGWDEADGNPTFDPKTGLPAGLGGTPVAIGVGTSRKSPDFNERRHAFCGLMSSMHSWGLYNERYGFSEFRVRAGGSKSVPIADSYAVETRAMLDGELERQERIKEELAADPATAAWVEEKNLTWNYKLLQFFDTLALYFNVRHEDERGEEVYVHVPRNADEDTSITMRSRGDGIYSLSPFPFAGDILMVTNYGRYLAPIPEAEAPDDMGAMLKALPAATQVYTLVTG